MDIKTIGIIGILAVAILAYAVFVGMRKADTGGEVVTQDEVALLEGQIDSLSEEMLDQLMTEMDDYSSTMEEDMAGDYGMFMYQ
jgi:hypothetical protein